MKIELLPVLQCVACHGEHTYEAGEHQLRCVQCGAVVPAQGDIPLFTPPPAGLVPSVKIERGPEVGTPWRRANWRFLKEQVARLDPQALILDVGAGRGDFAEALAGRKVLALDVYPYPEVDLVADLTQTSPLRAGSAGAVVLMNVMEHVPDTQALLAALARLLQPGGKLIVAIPFMVKIHQAPVDFVRYTHFALEKLGETYGLELESLEGYFDPVFFLSEGTGNLRHGILPELPGSRRRLAHLLLNSIEILAQQLSRVIGPGRLLQPAETRSMAPTGYHVVYRKKESR